MTLLTNKDPIASVNSDDVMHVVDTSDTSSNPAGTSKKATIDQIKEPIIADILLVMGTYASIGNTVADGTGNPNPGGVLTLTLPGNGGDDLLTPPVSPQPTVGGAYNGYEKVTSLSEIDSGGELSVLSGELVVGANGDGVFNTPHAYIEISSSTNNNNVGFVFGIERSGSVYFSQRVTGTLVSSNTSRSNVSGGGNVTLVADDKLSLWACSEKAADITIYDANLGLQMVTR